jgi:glycosyltransferase involved in cell wall biosynthesis
MIEGSMDVTIAICTWNRANLLRQTLEAFTRMNSPSGHTWELLVVNNNCTDDTEHVLESFQDRLPIRWLFEARAGKSHAANTVLQRARGRWILWTDDDVLVDPNWIVECLNTAKRFPNAAAIGGLIEPWFPSSCDPDVLAAFPIAAKGFCGLDHGAEERVLSDEELIYGANMAFNREAVNGLQFDTTLGPNRVSTVTGEETDFIRRVRARGDLVVWSPRMRVKHWVDPSRLTLGYLTRFYADHARTLVRLGTLPDSFTIPGPIMFGAPRWLWRSTASAYLRYAVARFRRSPDAFVSLREFSFLRGILVENRAISRRSKVA